jgi:predicted nucleic-acid-binding protein
VFRLINLGGKIPEEIRLEDKSELEQLRLINKLTEKQRETIYEIINTMLTKQQFKEFFENQLINA